MTSKHRENINLVSFICLSFLVISFSKQLLIKYLVTQNKKKSSRPLVPFVLSECQITWYLFINCTQATSFWIRFQE